MRNDAASFAIRLPREPTTLTRRIAEVVGRRLAELGGAHTAAGEPDVTVRFDLRQGIGPEGFQISDAGDGSILITGNDERGLLYGAGRFLHGCRRTERGFAPGPWRGTSVPGKPVRGIYLATHFHNFYHEAPTDDVLRYIEDLALWGFNLVLVWFGMEEYTGMDDPGARAMIGRLRMLLRIVKDLGLDVCLGCIGNDGWKNPPVSIKADKMLPGHAGYHTRRDDHIYNLGNEVCPSKPGVPEMEVRFCREKLAAFADIGVDYWIVWPYDNGGCTCAECSPWGINGYLRMAELLARTYRQEFPRGKVILSTWYFDRWADGEWAGITERFNRQKPDWVDYIMADDYGGVYPPYPLAHGSPGGFPMLSFPEISMHLHQPWGGFGAIPLPGYLQSLWDNTRGVLSGGVPYSEGIFEDMNKAICAQLFWEPERPAMETVKEYIGFFFSPAVVDEVTRAVQIMERNLERKREVKDGIVRFVMKSTEEAEEALRLIEAAEMRLAPPVRTSWRWRLVRVRALVDAELARNDFRVSETCAAAFRELTDMYHAEHARDVVKPPSA